MDMLDYRMHYVVMKNEERTRSLDRERRMQRLLRGNPPLPQPRAERRRRSIPALIGLLVPSHDAK